MCSFFLSCDCPRSICVRISAVVSRAPHPFPNPLALPTKTSQTSEQNVVQSLSAPFALLAFSACCIYLPSSHLHLYTPRSSLNAAAHALLPAQKYYFRHNPANISPLRFASNCKPCVGFDFPRCLTSARRLTTYTWTCKNHDFLFNVFD